MTRVGTTSWFIRHELRLTWRDWMYMLGGGRRRPALTPMIAIGLFLAFMHLLAFIVVGPLVEEGIAVDRRTLVTVTGGIFLALTTMTSQAMDQVTRAFYTRGDLDLILSSPAPLHRVFAVRMTAIAATTAALTFAIAGPFINALAVLAGPHWLTAYGVILALGALATAFSLVIAIGLFRSLGPRLTRTISQIIAAMIGAAFVIGIQAAAILSIGGYSRLSFLSSEAVSRIAPDLSNPLWWPARAVMGDFGLFLLLLSIGFAVLWAVIRVTAPNFGNHVIAASGMEEVAPKRYAGRQPFRLLPPKRALRRKEWLALRRDPWLMSESLMQVLYLVPPALLLWLYYADSIGSLLVLVPILVMAAGQLAGGLAWLAVSGEDAPELVASAPVSLTAILWAKVETVLGAVTLVFAPLLLGLAIAAPWLAVITGLGIVIAAMSSTAIQIWFRAQAKRSRFRSRQTSSRLATLAEALSSICWAGTAVLAGIGTWLAVIAAAIALITLACAWTMSPKRGSWEYIPG